MNFRKHLSDRLETRIVENLDVIVKDLSDIRDSCETGPSVGHHTPDVPKSQAGKITTETERQGTPTQER